LSTTSVIATLNKRLEVLKVRSALGSAVRSIMAEMVVRIFEEGKNSSGGKIGTYNSTDELYVNPDTLPRRVSPRGKPGKERKVANRQTTYFESYKSLRREVGRESGFVNLRLTNDLQSDWANSEVTDGIAVNPKPVEVNQLRYDIRLKREINREKREGLEKKYGPIFKLTEQEKQRYFEILAKKLALQDA
jgi:hypothetical protein